jgi:hypothetical protein
MIGRKKASKGERIWKEAVFTYVKCYNSNTLKELKNILKVLFRYKLSPAETRNKFFFTTDLVL